MDSNNLVDITRNYYDSHEADNFYFHIWGGEDIHVGLYESEQTPIREASRQTVARMAEHLPLEQDLQVLDIGAGYGGSARYLATEYDCPVCCLNLSETENRRNREKNLEQGLAGRIEVHTGNFESLPFANSSYDVVWCQDAILHSGRKDRVFAEVDRVLRHGGHFIFTDPMQADDCPEGVLQPVLDRIHLEEMGSVKKYRSFAADLGWKELYIEEMPHQLVNHYSSVLHAVVRQYDEIVRHCSQSYIDRMRRGLQHWIEAGEQGYLNWGILHFQKP